MNKTINKLILLCSSAILISACTNEPELENTSLSNTATDDNYWTEERIANAVEMPIPELTDEDKAKFKYYPPKDQSEKVVEPSAGEQGSEIALTADGTVTEANVKQRPFWNGGKLFFTTPDGDSSCTAQFVGSNRVLMTAAHCVMDGKTGKWYKNFNFRRAYNSGGGQNVGWECASVYKAWYDTGSENYPYDYAFLYTNTDSGAGWLGFRTGIPYSSWTAIGYPKNFYCAKKMGRVTGNKGTVGTGVIQMDDNPMYKGASGGAWIGDLNSASTSGNYAIGLNSYATSDVTSLWGPQFDSATHSLLKHVEGKGCK